MDISKAFGSVVHFILLYEQNHINMVWIIFIYETEVSFLRFHVSLLTLEFFKHVLKVNLEIPWGSVSEPLVFTVYAEDSNYKLSEKSEWVEPLTPIESLNHKKMCTVKNKTL